MVLPAIVRSTSYYSTVTGFMGDNMPAITITGTDHMTNATELRRLLAQPDIVTAPGVYDAFSALLAAQAGFPALYLSGASIAYTRLGRPDIGLVDMGEVAAVTAHIRDRVELPLIVDGDTGFGNALNVIRTVKVFERAGASVIQLEDQAMPKRCGHLAGKTLVPAAEMAGKLHAAQDARSDAAVMIMARTDAIAVEGFEAALERAERYVEAGCDILFIEALRDEVQMRSACARFAGRVPLLANMVEGGKSPLLDSATLQDIGFSLVIFPGGTARAAAYALQQYFRELQTHGSSAGLRERMLDFQGLNDLLGTETLLAQGQRYDAAQYR
jgi:2-methylisocitrate lyase-like PEP mutase family enzyme